jgi:hypothetical protein
MGHTDWSSTQNDHPFSWSNLASPARMHTHAEGLTKSSFLVRHTVGERKAEILWMVNKLQPVNMMESSDGTTTTDTIPTDKDCGCFF